MDESQTHCAQDCQIRRILSFVLVGLQLVLSAVIFATYGLPSRPIQFLLLLLAVGLGAWAILSMAPGTVSVVPSPRDRAQLCSRGPYKLMRHPMYTGLLLGTLSFVAFSASQQGWLLWASLLATLYIKAYYEESMLAAKYAGYAAYRRETGMFIPRTIRLPN